MEFELPDWWGTDPLSKYILNVYENSALTFVNFPGPFLRLKEIDALFQDVMAVSWETNSEEDEFLPLFIGRSHSAYLAAILLSVGGLPVEPYMVMRGCLENALYAIYMQNDPERIITWMKREDSKEAEKKVRSEFSITSAKKLLLSRNAALGKRASDLYERTIRYGAHPNVAGHLTSIELLENKGIISCLMPGTVPFKMCIQTTAQIGLCSLWIFECMFSDHFLAAGITERLRKAEWKDNQDSANNS